MKTLRAICPGIFAFALAAGCGQATDAPKITLIGHISLAADALDLEKETVGAIGSGGAFDTKSGHWVFISDRGPDDGKIDYRPRFDELKLDHNRKPGIALIKTTSFRGADDFLMTGLIPDAKDATEPRMADGRKCIDPEGIAIAADSLYVSDEYGPFLYQFDRVNGRMLRFLKPPENYLPRTADGEIDFSNQKSLVSGREPNRGFEGLALLPNGKSAAVLLQSGLIQDGGKKARWTRLLVLDLVDGKPLAEYAYPLASADEINAGQHLSGTEALKQNDLCVTEITALNEYEFLVLERDNRGADGSASPRAARHKCIYLVDTRGATNLLALAGRPYDQLPGAQNFRALAAASDVTPLRKKPFVDLLRQPLAKFGLDPHKLAEKWEALAVTPRDAKGYRRLIVASDNDFLNPTLYLGGKTVQFPRAVQTVATEFLIFDLAP